MSTSDADSQPGATLTGAPEAGAAKSGAAPMTRPPVCVAFVWHMHQPYYRSAKTGDFQMPWARLHAVKDYLDMVEILADYPTIHQTFNLVPSLVKQLEDYAAGGLPEGRAVAADVGAPAGAAEGCAGGAATGTARWACCCC